MSSRYPAVVESIALRDLATAARHVYCSSGASTNSSTLRSGS
jgi:hypothetical protein